MNQRHKAKRHSSIRLNEHERNLLVRLYTERRIPGEQYENRTKELNELVAVWNGHTGRLDTGGVLIHYMRTQRKRGKWVRFDGAHLRQPEPPAMSADEIEILVAIYNEEVATMGVGSDVLAYEEVLAKFIAREFADRSGRIIPEGQLVAKLTYLRKQGVLPKAADVTPQSEEPTIGFDDIGLAV